MLAKRVRTRRYHGAGAKMHALAFSFRVIYFLKLKHMMWFQQKNNAPPRVVAAKAEVSVLR
ncbi:hypothetical protein [Ralstonia pseudosolanacearum]|uniref:hypothetical protein n=1 Tax=Ralstonia pseudosolanacearum TaxID=1310165 RepID=UPI000B0B940E